MIEPSAPTVSVDELIQKVREQVAKRQPLAETTGRITRNTLPAMPTSPINLYLNHIEAILRDAETRAQVRTKLPDKFYRIPLIGKFERLFLKVFNFLFRDQRVVNLGLIAAFRESMAVQRQIIDQQRQVIDEMNQKIAGISDRVQGFDHRYIRNDAYVKSDLMQQKRLITLFLEEARQRLPEPFSSQQLQAFVNEESHFLDAFYAAFEDQFRGSQEDILSRLQVYLPFIESAKIGTPDAPILDVGCGRGEWLELLKSHGYVASGIDLNRVLLEECRVRALEVSEADVLTHLQSLPDNSLGGVTGFHIIEHLPFELLVRLFDEIMRVLKPNGLIIFETPNPENVLVGSFTFYFDPTHRHPLPSAMVKFIAESRGFYNLGILNLHPYPEEFQFHGSEIAERLNHFFCSAQDYAIVGYKS